MSRLWVLLVVVLAAGCPSAPYRTLKPNLGGPRPIEALDTVFLEEMTWMEVRDALKAGKTTVLVPTGGVEQTGARWRVRRANRMATLCCTFHGDLWTPYWDHLLN